MKLPTVAPGGEIEPHRTERPVSLPATDRFSASVFNPPTGPSITPETVHQISGIIRFAVENAAEIANRGRLAA